MTKREQAVQYLYSVVAPLCGKPEALTVVDTLDERGLVLTLMVHSGDMALIVGRKGSVIGAIRKVMHVWGAIHTAGVTVMVQEIK